MSRTSSQEASWTRLSASTRATRAPASRDTFETLSYCFGTISCQKRASICNFWPFITHFDCAIQRQIYLENTTTFLLLFLTIIAITINWALLSKQLRNNEKVLYSLAGQIYYPNNYHPEKLNGFCNRLRNLTEFQQWYLRARDLRSLKLWLSARLQL